MVCQLGNRYIVDISRGIMGDSATALRFTAIKATLDVYRNQALRVKRGGALTLRRRARVTWSMTNTEM